MLHIITGLSDGGAEAVLYRLITADRGHSHTVIALMDAGRYGPLLSDAGIVVHTLDMPRGRVTRDGLRMLWRLLRESGADVVQTWMYHADLVGGIVARLMGKRAVVWGIRNTYLGNVRTRLVVQVCAAVSRIVPQRIVSCSSAAVRLHVRLGYAERKMTVIPNGYDLERLHRESEARVRLRGSWDVPADACVLGLVARWDPSKDHSTLIAALERVSQSTDRKFRLALVGGGMEPSNAVLVDMLERSGLAQSVVLLGPRRDIAGIMSALDVHVLSSRAEAFPNVVAEAMACETPCIVTDTGDAALIVGETGWVVPARNPELLAGAIQSAIHAFHDSSAWAARQRAARRRIASHFSLDRMVKAYSEVWHEAATS